MTLYFSCVNMSLSVCPVGYVGLGTVGAATWWYLFDDEGPQVSFYQLVSYTHCSTPVLKMRHHCQPPRVPLL